jgi:hypothetical protein
MDAFDYPAVAHQRRHGAQGYDTNVRLPTAHGFATSLRFVASAVCFANNGERADGLPAET